MEETNSAFKSLWGNESYQTCQAQIFISNRAESGGPSSIYSERAQLFSSNIVNTLIVLLILKQIIVKTSHSSPLLTPVMASTHNSLEAAATERKARLAQLKSLKRKQPDPDPDNADLPPASDNNPQDSTPSTPSVTELYLSGRNYDSTTRGPKLGFEAPPIASDFKTLEDRAAEIAIETHKIAAEDEEADKPIDLFKLQPKKLNWDLKRDMARKLERLKVQTENAIARMVRERIDGQRSKVEEKSHGEQGANGKRIGGGANGDRDAMGLKGEELVEGVHVREREEAEEERREKDDEEADGDL